MNKPIQGTKSIKVAVDSSEDIHEIIWNIKNEYLYELNNEMVVRLPNLSIIEIASSPDSGVVKYGDKVKTSIKIKNDGDAPIYQPFTTSLYVNGRFAGGFESSSCYRSNYDCLYWVEDWWNAICTWIYQCLCRCIQPNM